MELGCNCHGVSYAAPPITYCLLQLYYIFTVVAARGAVCKIHVSSPDGLSSPNQSRVQTRMGVLGRFSAPEGGQAAAKPPSRRRILG